MITFGLPQAGTEYMRGCGGRMGNSESGSDSVSKGWYVARRGGGCAKGTPDSNIIQIKSSREVCVGVTLSNGWEVTNA